MKTISLVSLALTSLLFCAFVIFYVQNSRSRKYVYIDSQKLVNGYKGMVDARKVYESKLTTWRANLDTLHSEAEKKIKEYEVTGGRLSDREKKLMEELIQSKQDQFTKYQQMVSENVKKEDDELTSKVLSKVNDFVKRYGKANGHTIIMAATQYGNIVYADTEVDITEEVLKGLNAEYNK
ncbi:MAG TPA: OmpH family outer membrane protein [Cyclobacteriaceae bacterium]|nr:OmpH family outer membrane protein [Cyclobacteriaceae bacterium]